MTDYGQLFPEFNGNKEIGVLKPLPAPLDDLFSLASRLMGLADDCPNCASGIHPELSALAKSILHTLVVLLAISSNQEVLGGSRDGLYLNGTETLLAARHAFPAFVYLVDVASDYSSFEAVAKCHPELLTLRDKLYEACEQ